MMNRFFCHVCVCVPVVALRASHPASGRTRCRAGWIAPVDRFEDVDVLVGTEKEVERIGAHESEPEVHVGAVVLVGAEEVRSMRPRTFENRVSASTA